MISGIPPYRHLDPIQAMFKIASEMFKIDKAGLPPISSELLVMRHELKVIRNIVLYIKEFLRVIFVPIEDRPLVEDLLKSNWLLCN